MPSMTVETYDPGLLEVGEQKIPRAFCSASLPDIGETQD